MSLPLDPFAWLVPQLATNTPADTSACFRVLSSVQGTFELRAPGLPSVPVPPFVPTSFDDQTLYAASVTVSGLSPDTTYDFDLVTTAGGVCDGARICTWPASAGSPTASSFRLFLGSCFSTKTHTASGNQLRGLTSTLRAQGVMPHLKVFCGDQVYLDIPTLENLPLAEAAMQRFVLDKYLENWGAVDSTTSGFGALLRTGSNAFMSDDHEFWNNFPNTAIYALSLYRILDGKQRSAWFEASARRALAVFQSVPPGIRVARVTLSGIPLTLITLDGRYQRTDKKAHYPQDLTLLRTTLQSCTGPAIVVLSQPLFDRGSGGRLNRWWHTHVTDLGIADFEDFRELVDALASCRSDVCVLSGDIHGGRVSVVSGNHHAINHQIYEVVSSPLSLVASPVQAWGGKAPGGKYPDIAGDHPMYGDIEPLNNAPIQTNHGVLLELSAVGRKVRVALRYLTTDRGTDIATGVLPIYLESRP